MPDVHAAARRRGKGFAYILTLMTVAFLVILGTWANYAVLDEVTRQASSVAPDITASPVPLYQGALIMAPRDRAGDPPGRREAAGDAGHRQGLPTPSGGSPARPQAASQGFRPGARGVAMRDIGSHARRRPKALGSRRSGRAGEPPEGVGKPCR